MLQLPDQERFDRLTQVPFPRWGTLRQRFEAPVEPDIPAAVRREFLRPGIRERIRPGMRVALGVGSRGVASIDVIVRAAVAAVRELGANPFIVPAMGSHGGATATGQAEVLAGYGVAEATVGAPVVSSMEVVQLDTLSTGLPLYFDQVAAGADLIVPINRIKLHTAFRGPVESGLCKMLAIGLGKHAGATTLHNDGIWNFRERLLEVTPKILAKVPVGFGLAVVENARDTVARLEAVPAEQLLVREPELLQMARRLMPRILFDELDVLVVGAIGKNISGSGMDPNITGRFSVAGVESGGPKVNKILVLDLTPETHGNATGIGMADLTTRRVLDKLDLESTYINIITSTICPSARIPVVMHNDRQAVGMAIKTCNRVDPNQLRLVQIENTLELEHIRVSEALWHEAAGRADLEQVGALQPMAFTPAGDLIRP